MKVLLFVWIASLGLLATHQAYAQTNPYRSGSDTETRQNIPAEKELRAILRESPWYVYPALDSGVVEFNKSARPDSYMLTFEKGEGVLITCNECSDIVGTYRLKKNTLAVTLYYPKNLVSIAYTYEIVSADKDRIVMKNTFAQTVK